MNTPLPPRALALALATVCLAPAAYAQSAAQTPAQSQTAAALPTKGEHTLAPEQLIKLIALQNADALTADLQREATGHLANAERALYEPALFSRYRREHTDRPRSADDALSKLAEYPDTLEQSSSFDAGIKRRLSTGGEVQLAYQWRGRTNNMLQLYNLDQSSGEYRGGVTITLKQPLLRGAGRDVTEADLKIVELEHKLDTQRYKDRLQKAASEGMNAYWQLYRAQQSHQMRVESLANIRKVESDLKRRLEGGFASKTDLLEAKIAATGRDAEVTRALRLVSEAQARLRTVLNLPGVEYAALTFRPQTTPDEAAAFGPELAERYQQALAAWPGVRISELRRDQEEIRLKVAQDQKKSDLSLELGYNTNSLSTQGKTAWEDSWRTIHPGYYAGVNLDMPLGNQRAESRHAAQRARLRAAQLEIDSTRAALANDLATRIDQLKSAHREMQQLSEDVGLNEQLLKAEQTQFDLGRSRLSAVLNRENLLLEARQRHLDAATRLELARLALMSADGSLLERYSVSVAE